MTRPHDSQVERPGRQRGYTLVEIMVVALIAPLMVTIATQALTSSKGLADDSRAELRVHEELRRDLEAVADIVRGADIETFTGFDENGVAVRPAFRSVLGADAAGRVYDERQEIFWRATTEEVDGVQFPGEVVHAQGGTIRVIAPQVPRDGFSVRLEGGTLVIRTTAWYATVERRTAQVTGETAVALRN